MKRIQIVIPIGIMLFFSINLFSQPIQWDKKVVPKKIEEYHFVDGRIQLDPNSNFLSKYSKKGNLIEVIRFDNKNNTLDSLVYFPSGKTKVRVRKTYDGVLSEFYHPNGKLQLKQLSDPNTKKVIDHQSYTNTGKLLNDNDQRIITYDHLGRIKKSSQSQGYYNLVKEYRYSNNGELNSVLQYHEMQSPAEVIFMNGANANVMHSGIKNPFTNTFEQKGEFDFSVTNIDRSDIGILDVRPPMDKKSIAFQNQYKQFVEEKEAYYLFPNGEIKKEKRLLTQRGKDGMLVVSCQVDSIYTFKKYAYVFDQEDKLLSKKEWVKRTKTPIRVYQYEDDKLNKIVHIHPDSSVFALTTVMVSEEKDKIVYNHYEPYQELSYSKVESYNEGKLIDVNYFDPKGKSISIPRKSSFQLSNNTEVINDNGKMMAIGAEHFSDAPIEYHYEYIQDDTIYTRVIQSGQQILLNSKVYDQFGQLYQDVNLYPNGNVEGTRYDTFMVDNRLMKRVKRENGNETFCQKYIYDLKGKLAAVLTYPKGEKIVVGKELIKYAENGDTLSIHTITGKDTISTHYYYERDKKKRITRFGKILSIRGMQDTLLDANYFFKGKRKSAVILKGNPVFRAQVDTLRKQWDENNVLRNITRSSQGGKVKGIQHFYANGKPEIEVDQYGYESYYFENGNLKGHGRLGRFLELFDEQHRILFQRKSDNSIAYYKYQYRAKPIEGYDRYDLFDSVYVTNQDSVIAQSLAVLEDSNSDHYVVTLLSENEYLYENRISGKRFIFRSDSSSEKKLAFGAFVQKERIRFQDQLDDHGNWIKRKVLKESGQEEYYERNIEYWQK